MSTPPRITSCGIYSPSWLSCFSPFINIDTSLKSLVIRISMSLSYHAVPFQPGLLQHSSFVYGTAAAAVEPVAKVKCFEWVSAGQSGITHKKVIGEGSYSVVHEVVFSLLISNQKMYDVLNKKVSTQNHFSNPKWTAVLCSESYQLSQYLRGPEAWNRCE